MIGTFLLCFEGSDKFPMDPYLYGWILFIRNGGLTFFEIKWQNVQKVCNHENPKHINLIIFCESYTARRGSSSDCAQTIYWMGVDHLLTRFTFVFHLKQFRPFHSGSTSALFNVSIILLCLFSLSRYFIRANHFNPLPFQILFHILPSIFYAEMRRLVAHSSVKLFLSDPFDTPEFKPTFNSSELPCKGCIDVSSEIRFSSCEEQREQNRREVTRRTYELKNLSFWPVTVQCCVSWNKENWTGSQSLFREPHLCSQRCPNLRADRSHVSRSWVSGVPAQPDMVLAACS